LEPEKNEESENGVESDISDHAENGPVESDTSDDAENGPVESDTSDVAENGPVESDTSDGAENGPVESDTSDDAENGPVESDTSDGAENGPVETDYLEGAEIGETKWIYENTNLAVENLNPESNGETSVVANENSSDSRESEKAVNFEVVDSVDNDILGDGASIVPNEVHEAEVFVGANGKVMTVSGLLLVLGALLI